MNSFDIPIIGESNNVPQDDPEFTLNMYAEMVTKDIYTLKPTPGTELESQFAVSGGGRGMITVDGRLFGVRGGFFQEMVGTTPVIRGSLQSNVSEKVAMIFNAPPNGDSQILIVDGSKGYVFELSTNTFTTLTGTGGDNFLGGGNQAVFCAGRAFVFVPGTTQFQCSDLYDFLNWNALANSTAQSLNTPLKSLVSNGDLLYLLSDDGFEVWQDQGLDTFPVRQILAGYKIGILAPNSALFIEGYAYWLGRTDTGEGVAYRHAGGGPPERISTHPIERTIADLDTPSDAIGATYSSLGHVFYLLNFRAGNKTICWDKTTGLWHNRAIRDAQTNTISALPWVSTVIYNGEILVMDYRNGNVLHVDDDIYTDQGDPIVRERILAVIPKEGDWLSYYQSVELFGQVGNTPVGQQDPSIMMRYSGDRGMTWSLEEWAATGGNYSYETRTRWVGLGSAFGLALWFKVVASQFISWRMVRLYAE